MRQEYKNELEQLKARMEKAEKFAERLPIFANQILEDKYTGEEEWLNFGSQFKQLPLGWGIKRGLYTKDNLRTITNYHGAYHGYFFNIYINSYSLFDHHYSFGLDDVVKNVDVFFYDKINSTFYATDEQITALLEALNEWYIRASKENKVYINNKKIEEAQKQLAKAKAELEALGSNSHSK